MKETIQTPFGKPHFVSLSGSRLYGIHTEKSDWDYMGAVIEPPDYVVGLTNFQYQNGFEQYEFKGDNYEGTIYSLRKFVRMLANGNPTTLCILFSTEAIDTLGILTDEFRSMVLSQRSGSRFLKYMAAQRNSMIKQRSKGIERKALVDAHGYDTKFAGHLIRLGYQGIEFLTEGHVTLPMEQQQRETVLLIKNGKVSYSDVIEMSIRLEDAMNEALRKTPLPAEPQTEKLNEWLVAAYKSDWLRR